MKFSVLLSVYRKEQPSFLQQSLESIFTQTLLPDEVVLVKDGALPDELERIIKEYQVKYPRLKVLPLALNGGLSRALNEGLKHCSFDLVARMDTDDIAYPTRFEKQIGFMQSHPDIDIVGSYATKIDESNIESDMLKVPTTHKDIYRLIWSCPFIHPTVVFRKSKLIEAGSYNPEAGPRQDDYELWFRCAAKGLRFANIAEPLLFYRFVDESVKKNDIKVGWWRFKTGLQGCLKLKCSFIAYIGIIVPLFRSLLPYPMNIYFNHLLEKINPRNR